MSRFQKLASATTLMAMLLVMVGALVRATGSGLGCPDWPQCHGSWIPPLEKTAIIEYSHRLIASIVGFLVLAMAVLAWLKHRTTSSVFWPSLLALVTVIVQAGVGRQVVMDELHADTVVLHFFLSLALVGLLATATVNSFSPRGGRWDGIARHAAVTTGTAFAVLMVGATVVQQRAGAEVFSDWPLMNGSLLPPDGSRPLLHWTHRLVAALLGVVLGYLALRVTRRQPRDRTLVMLTHGAFALYLVQVLLGGFNVLSGSAAWTVVGHVLTGELLWVTLVSLSIVSYRRAPVGASAEGRAARPVLGGAASASGLGARIKAYFLLTKPRIIELLLITTVPAMILAARGWPSPWLVLATLVGGSMAAGSANCINCYLDRDIDEKMQRTSVRPLPSHQVTPANAVRFGVVLGALSVAFMTWAVNLPAALLSLGAILFYVFVYTIGLKRHTPSNIVIGGAAGAAPALIGWAAVTGDVGRPAWVLFAIIFYWTPPHFWALALRYSDDYKAAGVPMLPVVRGVEETTRQIVLYAVVLLAVSLLLYPVAELGVLYLAAASVMGAAFVFYSLRLRSKPDGKGAMSLFHFSISYLVLVFVALGADVLLDVPAVDSLYPIVLVAAATIFIVFSAAILFAVVGYRRPEGVPGRVRVLAIEVLWTIIPLIMMTALFMLSWSSVALASH
ncbi:MAG TPA: heme o synthase [Actinomycetota bacterium]|nr:heme o synthase [Actinomycetota bacterium]